MTPLDMASRKMKSAPDDVQARLAFFQRLAECELFVLLDAEAGGETFSPKVFELSEGSVVLAFDTEARLAEFSNAPAPCIGVSGRVLMLLLADAGLGLGVNLDVAPSSELLDASAVAWCANVIGQGAKADLGQPVEVSKPQNLPANIVEAVDAKLAAIAGAGQAAYLIGFGYADGTFRNALVLLDVIETAQSALAQTINEAVSFSGLDNAALDVVFLTSDDPMVERIARLGLRFDLPEAEAEVTRVLKVPGSDPDAPPRLK